MIALMLTTALTGFAQQTKVNFSQARLLDVNSEAYIKPAVADLVVDKKWGKNEKDPKYHSEEGRVHFVYLMSKDEAEKDLGGDMSNIRSFIVFKACEKYSCDVILGGTFNIRSAEKGRDGTNDGYVVTMYGFPANFTNWRICTTQDFEWDGWMRLRSNVDKPEDQKAKTSAVRK